MINKGKYNKLAISSKAKNGIILTDDEGHEAIMHISEEKLFKDEEELDVFVFNDSEGNLLATLKKPNIQLGEFNYLKVINVNQHGAFLDWGISRDLFVPYSEQKMDMEEGKWYLVHMYLDKLSNRLAASAKVGKFIEQENIDLEYNQEVDLLICENSDLGVNAIINNKYRGLIFKSDMFGPLKIGQKTKGYIKQIREDNKIDIALQKQGYRGFIDAGEKAILDKLKQHNGFLSVNDDSAPEEIYGILHMSKKSFKKALGSLFKQKAVAIEIDGIRLLRKDV